MAEPIEPGIFAPLLQELKGLYGKRIPEEDLHDLKAIIHKYFSDKYSAREELQVAEIGAVRDDFNEWLHDRWK